MGTLENEKKETQKRFDKLVEDTKTAKVDSRKIKEVFKQAKSLLRSGELSTIRRLIERYVEKVVIYPEHVYVEFNLGLDINKEIPQNPTAKAGASRRLCKWNNLPNIWS